MNRNKPRQTLQNLNQEDHMISVGIDVSKGKSTACILTYGNKLLEKPFEVTHDKNGLEKLKDILLSFHEETKVVLEDTGHYHFPVIEYLAAHGIFVCSVNPLRMKKFCSQNIRKAKTDKIDSYRIALYGLTYWSELEPFKGTNPVYAQLRLLSRQYHCILDQVIRATVNLDVILDRVMPGIKTLMRDNAYNDRLELFLDKYVHYDNIVGMGEKRFVTNCLKWAKKQGYLIHERKAKDIFALAQKGIPVLDNSPLTAFIVKEAVRVSIELRKTRKSILAQLQNIASTLPEFQIIKSCSGIGNVLAALLISEIGDIKRFHSKRALVAYAGIDTPPYQSGKLFATERHITKRGNPYLRKIGYEIMLSKIRLKRANDEVYCFIQKKKQEGKGTKESLIAGLNKFLRSYYGKVKELYST